jgi:RHS repeat-associated protein
VTYLWQDDVPAAIVLGPNTPGNPSGQDKLLYLEVDHLNTPRIARDGQKRVVWRWDSDAFGSTAPNEDPDGDGIKTTINLRFPGQYFDAESGLHYNWHRYYDPQVGRYTQPDPIGAAGGMNSYAYVGGNPLGFSDPKGLMPAIPAAIALCAANMPLCAATAAATCWAYEPCRKSLIDGGKAICKTADNLIFNRPKNPPDVGPPNGWIQGPRRGRQYGPDGRPQLDIDKPHQGNERDHAHEWPGGEREEPGRPVSPWPPQQK